MIMNIKINQANECNYITVENNSGLVLTLADIGAAIRAIKVPDKDGGSKTVTLCPVSDELFATAYHGKTIGRTSGRIENATFTIDGKTALLERNNFGVDNLHGGASGFHAARFDCEVKQGKAYADIVFKRTSPSGEGGYFGDVDITVTYRVYDDANTFRIIFDGSSNANTLLNLTNHVYWNMGGDLVESVNDQILYLNAPKFGKLNERLIVEDVIPVTKEMDFRSPHKIGDYIYRDSVQLYTKGYDHPYFLAPHSFDDVVASLYSKRSGIKLEVRTTYPCIVFYSDGQADSNIEVFPGKRDEQYLAACLECQYHPDGIHQTPENCGIVSPERPYHEEIEYKFILMK